MKIINRITSWIINNKATVMELIAWFITLIAVTMFIKFLVNDRPEDNVLMRAAQLGDFMGGVIGTILMLATILLLFANLYVQKQELNDTKTELKLTRQSSQRQEFENTFFKLLENYEKYLNKKADHQGNLTNYDKLSQVEKEFRDRLFNYKRSRLIRRFTDYKLFNYDEFNDEIFKEEYIEKTLTNINAIINFINNSSDEIINNKVFYHSILLNTLRRNEQFVFSYQWIYRYPTALTQVSQEVEDVYCLDLKSYLIKVFPNTISPPKVSIALGQAPWREIKLNNLLSEVAFPKFEIRSEENKKHEIESIYLEGEQKEKIKINENNIPLSEHQIVQVTIFNAIKKIFDDRFKTPIENSYFHPTYGTDISNYSYDYTISFIIKNENHPFSYVIPFRYSANRGGDCKITLFRKVNNDLINDSSTY